MNSNSMILMIDIDKTYNQYFPKMEFEMTLNLHLLNYNNYKTYIP